MFCSMSSSNIKFECTCVYIVCQKKLIREFLHETGFQENEVVDYSLYLSSIQVLPNWQLVPIKSVQVIAGVVFDWHTRPEEYVLTRMARPAFNSAVVCTSNVGERKNILLFVAL